MLDSAQHPATVRPVLPMRPRSVDWLSVSQAAKIIGVDRTTLFKWRKAGQLEGVRTQKAGAYVYYWRPDVEAFRDRLAAGPDEPAN